MAKSPVWAPQHAVEGHAGMFQGHLDNAIQDKLQLDWPIILIAPQQEGPMDGDHDVLLPSVFGAV